MHPRSSCSWFLACAVTVIALQLGCYAGPLRSPAATSPAGAPIRRPTGAATGAGASALSTVRARLQGNWDLQSTETYPAPGEVVSLAAQGLLTYDDFGNLSLQATITDDAEQAAFWNISGRVAIDVFNQRMVFTKIDANLDPDTLPGEISPDQVRYFEFRDDLLITTVWDERGRTIAETVWKKIP